MKYSLAFDTKDYESKDRRYIIIPNSLIGKNLDVNNNLKSLCSFTCRFEDEMELKETIIKLIPSFKEYSEFKLVLVWSRETNGEKKIIANSVLYSNTSRYFDMEYLINYITDKLQNSAFLTKFFSLYEDHDYLSRYLDSLYNAVMNGNTNEIRKAVQLFLNRLFYGKTGFEYAKLYKLIVNVLDNDFGSKSTLSCCSSDSTEFGEYNPSSEVEEFELEWLKRRARLRQQNGGYY